MADEIPYWASANWVKRQRAIVAKQIHSKSDAHELGHPTFRDPEVKIINRMFKKLRGDRNAIALLAHVLSYTHETASNPPR